MILSVTVNLGNYENIKIESSEYDTIEECKDETRDALTKFGNEPRIQDFIKRVLVR